MSERTGIDIVDVIEIIGNFKRPLIEGQAILDAKLITCGIISRSKKTVILQALCLQTSNLKGLPHQIKVEIKFINNNKQFSCHCTCKVGSSGKCKHIIVTLRFSEENVKKGKLELAPVQSNNEKNAEYIIQDGRFNDEDIFQFLIDQSKWPEKHEKFNIRVSRDIYRGEDSPLHIAVAKNDLRKVKELLEINYNVDLGGHQGKTPLCLAAEKGFEAVVECLLSKNASVHKKDFFDDAPIHCAAYNGRTNVVGILLDHSADVNSQGKFGETALHIAARKGYEGIANLLLSRNASVDLRNNFDSGIRSDPAYILKFVDYHSIGNGNFGETPLHMAVRNGHETIVNLLLSRNASVDLINQVGMTPLYIAVTQKELKIAETLIDHGASVNVQGNTGMTPLMVAALNGDEAFVNLLILKNASLERKDFSNNAAIHYAALSGNLNVVNALLDRGADGNSKGVNGKTPLSFAVRTKKKVIKPYVIKEELIGSKKKYQEKLWVNPVLENEIFKVMKTLMNHGAEVNSKDFLDQTVSHEAAVLGYPGVVGFLASEKANFSIEDYVCFTPLQWAVYNGNIDVIKTLVKYGDDINRKGCNNVTALHLAITGNNTDLIKFLLSKNADSNVMSEDGRTPLDIAFQSSSEEYLKLLLDHGAKLEDDSFLGSKVLFDAVAKKSLNILNILLDSAKNIVSYPTVILNYAIRNNFYDGVQLLISFGANIEQKDVHGNIPLSSAVMSKNVDTVRLILNTAKDKLKANLTTFLDAGGDMKFVSNIPEGNRAEIIENRNLTALHIASKLGLVEIAKLLISYGASLEVRDERGYTPLHFACGGGNIELVKLLLDSEANKSSVGIDGRTPLHIACSRSLPAIVELLLSDPPAAINVADSNGYTALHFATINRSLRIVRLLLKLGADKEARTKDLKTPLHLASQSGQKEIVDVLLNSGANKDACDVDGMTPLHFAARERNLEIVESILNYGGLVNIGNKNGSTPLHLACESSFESTKMDVDVVRSLIDFGADVDLLDNNQMTSLHIASRDNSSECVEILLSAGADLSRRDDQLNQPIHNAALYGNYKIVHMLLTYQRGIILGMSVNGNQETPLILASREGHYDVVALLLQAGVESLQPDINGRTALHRSSGRGHLEIVKLLRQGLLNKDKIDDWGFTALNYAASWKGHQEVVGYLSTTQMNITLSHYLNKSNPIKQNSFDKKILKLSKLPVVTLGRPYSFIDYSDDINN